MSGTTSFFVHAVLIGVGATALMDLWSLIQKRIFGIPSPDYAMVGRWLGHLPRGRLFHDSINAAPPLDGEGVIGWTAHYVIGIAFATLLLGIWGLNWARDPSILPALIVGLATVAAPFLVLQPAFGAGVAASRTPHPNAARLRSVLNHLSFGVGLYIAAKGVSLLSLA